MYELCEILTNVKNTFFCVSEDAFARDCLGRGDERENSNRRGHGEKKRYIGREE